MCASEREKKKERKKEEEEEKKSAELVYALEELYWRALSLYFVFSFFLSLSRLQIANRMQN